MDLRKKKTAAAAASMKSVEFLDHKTKKKWIDEESEGICFMLYPRALNITWSWERYWTWDCFKETGEDNIEVAKLNAVCWLDIRGRIGVSKLSRGVEYEIVYVMKMTKQASGWELPINSTVTLLDGKVKQRLVTLLEKPRGEWFELNGGSFLSDEDGEDDETREIRFSLFEHGGHWKTGLIIKGVILRPKKD